MIAFFMHCISPHTERNRCLLHSRQVNLDDTPKKYPVLEQFTEYEYEILLIWIKELTTNVTVLVLE
jgi:hypothetical protein